MAQALTPPFLVAALVLCTAGLAKLRSPAPAARALAVLALPGGPRTVRALAAGETTLGLWCLVDPGRVAAGAMACVYALFTVLAALLARRRVSCGCFGGDDAPASIAQSGLSGVLSLFAVTGALSVPHGLHWVLQRGTVDAAVLIIGAAGAVYGIVLAYTEMPSAWGAWRPR